MEIIKGNVSFGCVPMYNKTFGENGLVDIEMAIDEGKYEVICRLSETTEKQASLLVDYMDGVGYCRYTSDGQIEPASLNWKFGLKTAKESLFSLLKANGCETKDMIKAGIYYHAHIFDEAGCTKQTDVTLRWKAAKDSLESKKICFAKPISEYPDDYLLIIKQ